MQAPLVEAPVQPIAETLPVIPAELKASAPVAAEPQAQAPSNGAGEAEYHGPRVQQDAPACANCGWIMSRSGTCYRCENCGNTSGCS